MTTRFTFSLSFLFFGFLLTESNAVSLVNGSFETNTNGGQFQGTGSTAITGWTTTLDGVEYFQPGLGNARDGDWVVDLAYFTSSLSGGISQILPTSVGEEIRLEFSLGTLQQSGRDGTAEIKLLIDDVEVQTYNVTNLSTTYLWEDFSYDHTAAGVNTKIEFRNEQNANLHFALVDGVGVSNVPEPSSTLLVSMAGLALLGRRVRR